MSERVAEMLVELLRDRVEPAGYVVPDPPLDRERGHWFIDVYAHGLRVTVEYKATMGFGVSLRSDDVGFGEKPDMVFVHVEDAIDQAMAFLRGR